MRLNLLSLLVFSNTSKKFFKHIMLNLLLNHRFITTYTIQPTHTDIESDVSGYDAWLGGVEGRLSALEDALKLGHSLTVKSSVMVS